MSEQDGILYLGPWVVVVEEFDRINLDVFAARIDAEYGIYRLLWTSATRCEARAE